MNGRQREDREALVSRVVAALREERFEFWDEIDEPDPTTVFIPITDGEKRAAVELWLTLNAGRIYAPWDQPRELKPLDSIRIANEFNLKNKFGMLLYTSATREPPGEARLYFEVPFHSLDVSYVVMAVRRFWRYIDIALTALVVEALKLGVRLDGMDQGIDDDGGSDGE